MDGISTPDVSTASTETASAPSEATASAAVQPEAVLAGQDTALQAQPDLQAAESVPAAPSELPDEVAFEQLNGPERGQNWKQARARIAELNQQVSQFSAHQPVIEQIEQRGGWEQVQQHAELGSLLFSQTQDPQTGQIRMTAEPLIERLASESPYTLDEIIWKGIHQADPYNPDQTIAHAFVRDYLRLDPNLLDTYRSIQSPQDAQKYLAPGQVTPEELAAIPEQFHDAFKSLTPRQREELGLADDETKLEFLQDKADALQARQFIAQQTQEREQQRAQAAQQFEQRVDQRHNELSAAVRDAAINGVREKLKTEARLSASDTHNEALHNDAIQWAVQQLMSDPASAQDNDKADAIYRLSANAELRGDKIQASQYKLQADAMSKALEGRFRNNVTKRVAFWSELLGGARQAQQQQVEQARPRAEIANSNQSTRQNQQTQTVGNGFIPSPQRIAQYEQLYKQSQMQNG